ALLALMSVSPATAETEDECRNNTDVQKFIDGKCNVLKGYDAIPRAAKEQKIQSIFPNHRHSKKLVRKKTDLDVLRDNQTLEEKKKLEVQHDRKSEKMDSTSNSTEQTKQTQTDLDKAKPN